MTKKDYDIIAACIGAEQSCKHDKKTLDSLSTRLVLELKLENPKFSESIFWSRVEYWRLAHGGEK